MWACCTESLSFLAPLLPLISLRLLEHVGVGRGITFDCGRWMSTDVDSATDDDSEPDFWTDVRPRSRTLRTRWVRPRCERGAAPGPPSHRNLQRLPSALCRTYHTVSVRVCAYVGTAHIPIQRVIELCFFSCPVPRSWNGSRRNRFIPVL